jgi:hypothetical protein
MTGLNWMVAGIVRAAVRRAALVTVAAVAVSALGGCTFGDEPVDVQPGVGPWFDDNCVPAECLFQCCQGWNYSKKPTLRGGSVPGSQCDEVRKKNSAYAEYVALMLEQWNWCSEEFHYFESGYCYDIQPLDAIKEFGADGQVVYSELSFLVCPPRGQPAAHPMEDVELIPRK